MKIRRMVFETIGRGAGHTGGPLSTRGIGIALCFFYKSIEPVRAGLLHVLGTRAEIGEAK